MAEGRSRWQCTYMRYLLLPGLASLFAVVACSSGPEVREAETQEAPLIGDIESMTRLPNGDYAVKCKDGTSEVKTTAEIVAQRVCEGGATGEQTCTRRCASRDWQGSCTRWGEDFCAADPSCVKRCTARDWQGACTTWGEDACGSGEQTCAKRCKARDWQGACTTWSEDFCGRTPSCVKRCKARDWQGACTEWSEDACGSGEQRCVERCTSRDWQGACTGWGEDHCGQSPSCARHCVERDWQGNCVRWGADQCGG